MTAETLLTLARAAEYMAATSELEDRNGRCATYLYDAAAQAREAASREQRSVRAA